MHRFASVASFRNPSCCFASITTLGKCRDASKLCATSQASRHFAAQAKCAQAKARHEPSHKPKSLSSPSIKATLCQGLGSPCYVFSSCLVAVLSACAHAGLIDRAKQYFYAMYSDYGVVPSPRHYTCMIDLLGRAGSLDEAQHLIRNMPFSPDAATWGALLGAAKVHGNIELAEKAAENIFKMEPDNSGMYVLLSNLYAASGRWYDVRQMRLKMRDKGIKKVPGYSWLEVQNNIHTFAAGDTCHPEKDRIYSFLEELESRMKQDGYVSSIKLVLHDVDEEEKEHMLKYHSERLAVVYGILTLPKHKPIRVMKNLRICEDCHTAIKHISKLERRLIIVRDSNRFHHFKQGECSCGDYW
uniref:DYW domain-containing protein n=1 Tax=Chenopodium quinoa TaxID=63459 RepID=A0A803MZ56_CHEQI